ncbi:EpsG family protein, partial [Escherichia sp. TW09231]
FLTLIGAYCCYYLGVNFITLLRYIPVSYVQYKFSDYISQAQGADFVPVNIFSVMQILHLLIVILSFVFSRKNILSHDKVLFIKIYSLSPLAFIILSSMPVFALRVSELFAISEIILIPSLPLLFRQKKFAKLVVIGICFIMFYINIYHLEILNEYSTL